MRSLAAKQFSLAARTALRYLAPLLLLAMIASLPVLVAAKLAPTFDAAHARWRLSVGGALAQVAWFSQVWLVAAVMPAMASIARGAPISQGRALVAGLAQLARAFVPVALVFAAVLLGTVALVVPGLALVVYLALTGASERLGEPLPAPLADSAALVRPVFWRVAAIAFVALAVNVAIANGGQLVLLGALPKKPGGAILAAMQVRPHVVAGLAAVSPVVACVLAAVASQRR